MYPTRSMSGYFLATPLRFELGHLKAIAVPPSNRNVIPFSAAVDMILLASFRMSNSVVVPLVPLVVLNRDQTDVREREPVGLKALGRFREA